MEATRVYNVWQVLGETGGWLHTLLASHVLPTKAREAMSLHILTAIRRLPQLAGSLKLTAQELAHRASRSGHLRISYGYLATKTGQSVRTAIRHVQRLIALGLLQTQRIRLTLTRFAVNSYTFLVGVVPLHTRSTDRVASTLPPREREQDTTLSLREEIARQRQSLHWLTQGSGLWERTQEEIARLEALQRREARG